MLETKLKEWGNSFGVIIPREELRKKRIEKGDIIIVSIKKKKKIDGFGIAKGANSFEREQDDQKREW